MLKEKVGTDDSYQTLSSSQMKQCIPSVGVFYEKPDRNDFAGIHLCKSGSLPIFRAPTRSATSDKGWKCSDHEVVSYDC